MSDFETVPIEEMRAMRLRIENDALRIERLQTQLLEKQTKVENGAREIERLRELLRESWEYLCGQRFSEQLIDKENVALQELMARLLDELEIPE